MIGWCPKTVPNRAAVIAYWCISILYCKPFQGCNTRRRRNIDKWTAPKRCLWDLLIFIERGDVLMHIITICLTLGVTNIWPIKNLSICNKGNTQWGYKLFDDVIIYTDMGSTMIISWLYSSITDCYIPTLNQFSVIDTITHFCCCIKSSLYQISIISH